MHVVGVELPDQPPTFRAGPHLYVAGACHFTPWRWATDGYLTGVSDGGACFFDAYYDIQAERFVYFAFHGEA
jgi:hypothetical protein